MERPLISVLMVNYNHGSTIGESVRSVLAQTYENLQVIIVDDGSTDSSVDVIREIGDERIELYCLEKNRHISYATNYGFAKVRGEYLARIDSDDVWYPEKLEIQMKFMEENPEYKVCFSWIDLIDEDGRDINEESRELLGLFETSFRGQSDCLHTFFFLGNCLSHPSVLMETGVMRETGDFRLAYMQLHDFDYWVRIAKRYPIYVLPKRLLAMRRFMHPDKVNINNSNASEVHSVRAFNEYADIKLHFFEDMTDELFISTFQGDFKCPDSASPDELECEKAFLLLKSCHPCNSLFSAGVQKFFELFQNERLTALLENKYNFTVKDFYQLTGQHVYQDTWIEEAMKNQKRLEEENLHLQEESRKLQEESKKLKGLIRHYELSTSWRMTKPLRAVGRLVKKRRINE